MRTHSGHLDTLGSKLRLLLSYNAETNNNCWVDRSKVGVHFFFFKYSVGLNVSWGFCISCDCFYLGRCLRYSVWFELNWFTSFSQSSDSNVASLFRYWPNVKIVQCLNSKPLAHILTKMAPLNLNAVNRASVIGYRTGMKLRKSK